MSLTLNENTCDFYPKKPKRYAFDVSRGARNVVDKKKISFRLQFMIDVSKNRRCLVNKSRKLNIFKLVEVVKRSHVILVKIMEDSKF